MRNLREMRTNRAKLITDARAIVEQAEAQKRSLSAEETQQYDALLTKATEAMTEIEREERLQEMEGKLGQSAGVSNLPEPETRNGKNVPLRETAAYADAFKRFLRNGDRNLAPLAEQRSLQADSDTAGGYLLAPMEMVNGLIKALDNSVFVRQYATKHTITSADSLGAASLDADPEDGDWTGELTTVDEDTAMAFGRRELKPHMLTKLIKVSRKLLNRLPSVESLVMERFGYKFGITQEKAHLTGTGVLQPMGVFTAALAGHGITTGRDVATGNTTTAFTADGLMNAKYALKPQYHAKARWAFHRDGVKMLAKLKDGEGRYMFDPDSGKLLSFPLHMSEYVPNTFTNGLYVGILGDFSYYWIADALSMEMQRLVELYAGTSQVGLVGRMESDGMPVLSEAFVRVKLA